MNTATFAGNIGRDAETKTVGDSTVTNFSVAVSTGYGDKKSTLWVSAAMWGERGRKLAQYLTSGQKVAISGDIDVRAYAAKDGTPKAEITCNVQRVTLQGSRPDAVPAASPKATASTMAAAGSDFEPDSSIPF